MSRLLIQLGVSALVALAVIGTTASIVVSRLIRQQREASATFHAQFVTEAILSHELTVRDVTAPIPARSERYRTLAGFVRSRVLIAPVVRLKIWSHNGTVLFSDEPRLDGRRFSFDGDLEIAFGGGVEAGVSNLTEPENTFERALAPKLFETYVPLRLEGSAPGSKPVAVAELYQDYAGIQRQSDRLFRTVLLTMLLCLAALSLVMFPVMFLVAKRLAERNAHLEEDARRSEELLRRELRTVTELRRLNRLQRDFVAVASHELRTPLTSIIGYAKTLRQPQFASDDASREEFLEAIERQGDRLFHLVENLLTSSHLEDQQFKLSITTFSFADLAREVVEGLGSRASRVQMAIPRDLPSLISDRQYVAQTLANLLGNALKFSPEETSCDLTAIGSGGILSFTVRDRGIGMPETELPHIFERFYQVDSSSTRRYGGIGLGLSLVKNLVDVLRGRIEVTSREHEGTAFTVSLPLVHPSVGAKEGHSMELAPIGNGQSSPAAGSIR